MPRKQRSSEARSFLAENGYKFSAQDISHADVQGFLNKKMPAGARRAVDNLFDGKDTPGEKVAGRLFDQVADTVLGDDVYMPSLLKPIANLFATSIRWTTVRSKKFFSC